MALSRKKLIVNIVFYALIALIYAFVIVMIISKFNDGAVYIFNIRYDVVLTDSMSEKNPEHLAFLEGTSQIQKMDLVRSSKINDDTILNIKDVVLFKSPELNNKTVMHRIVEIKNDYNTLTISGGEKQKCDQTVGVDLINYNSYIEFKTTQVKHIEFEYVSLNQTNDNYSLIVDNTFVDPTIIEDKIGNHYKYSVQYDCDTTRFYPVRISKHNEQKTYITKIKLISKNNDEYSFVADEFAQPDTGDYVKQYLTKQSYRLRGDKAKDFDNGGKYFERSALYSKVENVIPKAGLFVRFISSIPGIIMLIGVAFIVTFASYLYNRDKKPKVVESALAENIDNQINDDSETVKKEIGKENKNEDKDG